MSEAKKFQYVVMGVPWSNKTPHYPVAVFDTPEEAGTFVGRALLHSMEVSGHPGDRPLYIYPIERHPLPAKEIP